MPPPEGASGTESGSPADHAVRAVVARYVHDVRAALNTVVGFSELLDLSTLDDDQRRSLNLVAAAADELILLAAVAPVIAELETRTFSPAPSTVDPLRAARSAASALRRVAGVRGVKIALRPTEWSAVRADADNFDLVVRLILRELIVRSDPGGEVVVSCRSVADVVTIEMSARLQTRLAKPHGLAVDTPRPSDLVDDIGLGLATIVALGRRIVRDLRFDSGPDGDRIVLTLPLDTGVVAPAASLPRVMQDTSLVLLVEDNDSNRRLVERLVERRPHVQLRSLSRGGECHSEAVELRPALVLLDLDLPDLDGVEVLEQLRADRTTSDIPVVVVSADATSARQRELTRRGASGYITKPLDVSAFYSILDEFVPPAE